MTIQTINIGAAPNDSTGDSPRDAGTKLNANFSNNDHAASREVGTATGQIPDADILNMVGNVNYTSGNLSPNVFGASAAGDWVMTGYNAANNSVAVLSRDIQGVTAPLSVTVTGTFTLYDEAGNILAANITPSYSASTSSCVLVLLVTGVAVSGSARILNLRADSGASKIEMNF